MIRNRRAGRMTIVPMVLVLLVATASAFTFAGCGEGGGGATTTGSSGDSIIHPAGPNEVILRVDLGSGFVPVSYNLTRLPQFTLYGDGTVLVVGPTIEIYPGPAMPNLQTTKVSEEAIQAILSAAREAGLFATGLDYGRPTVTDVPTTIITVNADGTTYESSIYALGMEADPALTMEQQQARAAVSALLGKLQDPQTFETGELTWAPYDYSALAVYSIAVNASDLPGPDQVQPNRLEWPLGDLGTIGEPVQPEGFRKVVLSGDDLATLKPLLGQATQITLWTVGDREYNLYFRPLLPDETV
jgi:hypothetical protein